MSENEQIKPAYVGNAMQRDVDSGVGMIVELDLTELGEALKREDIKPHIKSWTSRQTNITHKVVKLAVFPLRPESANDYKTHSVKISTYVPKQRDDVQQSAPHAAQEYAQPPRSATLTAPGANDDGQQGEYNGDLPF